MNHAQMDELKKYIRITGDRNAKFVEFDFAINDPSLFVELVLPKDAFEKFCLIHQVIEMDADQQALNDAQENKWRYGIEETLIGSQRFL